jgi:transcriptional regulator with XRE-family HTH domain
MGASASFGSWLRQQRKFHDWTQAELAEQVGCSIALIRKYEADERRPNKSPGFWLMFSPFRHANVSFFSLMYGVARLAL